jgi:uncharacterized integral membrane protein
MNTAGRHHDGPVAVETGRAAPVTMPAMTAVYLVVALLGAAVAVFALQNGTPATVRFFVWHIEGLPLAGLILGAFAVGLVFAGVPLSIQRWRARAQARRLEARIRDLEGPSPPAVP